MATAEELLSSVSDADKILIISNDLRTINIPSGVTTLGVETDDDVLRLKFKMPRYVSDTDLSVFSIRINYVNANGESDAYTVSDAVIGSQYITFSWLVGPIATAYKGNTRFVVCMQTLTSEGVIDREFNTTIATLPVLEGLEVDEGIVTQYSDIIEQWRRELFGIGDTEEASIKAVSAAEQEAIANKGAEVLATIPEDYQTAVSMVDNADRTKADAIICSTQGETISVYDSSDDYLRGLRVFGKTTQVSTTGKNLLQHTQSPGDYIIQGVTFTVNDDGSVACNGTATNPATISFVDYYLTEDIVVSGCPAGGDVHKYRITADIYKDDTYVRTVFDVGSGVTISAEVADYIRVNVFIYTGITVSNLVMYPMVRLASNLDDSYEPYSGGIASPSPGWSQLLTSIENPTVNIYGKNLLKLVTSTQTINGVTFTVNTDNSVTIKGTATASVYYGLNYNLLSLIPGERYTMTGGLDGSSGSTYRLYAQTIDGKKFYADYGDGVTFTATDEQWQVLFAVYKDTTVDFTIYPMLRVKTVADATYEPYADQPNIELPYNLHAVPISEGGNYTDENGQQWICDEIDFERGVHVQRIGTIVYDGSADESWLVTGKQYHIAIKDKRNNYVQVPNGLLCSHFKVNPTVNTTIGYISETHYHNGNINILINMDDGVGGLDNFVSWLQSNPMTVYYVLATPIETPLTAEEIEWFRFAHTNYPNTTVLNDVGATMELKYNADTETWLYNLPKATEGQIQKYIDAWLDAHYTAAEGASF